MCVSLYRVEIHSMIRMHKNKTMNVVTDTPSFSSLPYMYIYVGPEDIYEGNLKLILGLVWTLIKEYQIKSRGKSLSTKKALLAWVNTVIPEYGVRVSISYRMVLVMYMHCRKL